MYAYKITLIIHTFVKENKRESILYLYLTILVRKKSYFSIFVTK